MSDVIVKPYIALSIIGSESGRQRWMPGAIIEMTDERALPLLVAGHVMPHPDNENPPKPEPPVTQVIEAGERAVLEDEPQQVRLPVPEPDEGSPRPEVTYQGARAVEGEEEDDHGDVGG